MFALNLMASRPVDSGRAVSNGADLAVVLVAGLAEMGSADAEVKSKICCAATMFARSSSCWMTKFRHSMKLPSVNASRDATCLPASRILLPRRATRRCERFSQSGKRRCNRNSTRYCCRISPIG